MLRRRRPQKNEAIHFSFDSFLDLVTNVVGIIIKLILITWIGARSYHASMQWIAPSNADATGLPSSATQAPPKLSDDPLYSKLEVARAEVEEAKVRLSAQLKDGAAVAEKTKVTQAQLTALARRYGSLENEAKDVAARNAERGAQVRAVSLSTDEIRARAKTLLAEIQTLEAAPVTTKQLKYHAPLSRTVHVDEVFFECKGERVTFIDLPAFMIEIKQSMDGIANELKQTWRVERTTARVGAYRLRYAIEREQSLLDAGPGASSGGFRYGLSEWVVEPSGDERGETLQAALAPKSAFRRLADPLDGNLTVVTFWVYPDSFELFRHLRDHLYERGLDVAGRPLPPGAPIAASKSGTASRGQ